MANPDSVRSAPLIAERASVLARHSSPYRDPAARVSWERLSTASFWLPESALSLHGVAAFDNLPLVDRQRLSHYEFAQFLEAGLWLEGIFLERLARATADLGADRSARIYQLHELREEAGHSLMFLEFLTRAKLCDSSAPPHRDRLLSGLGRYLPFDSALFWGAILLGEEVPDRLNRYIRLHADGVCPAVIELCALHSTDEARHIVYGREILQQRLATMSPFVRRITARALSIVLRRFITAFYYPDDDLYRRAGLPDGRWVAQARQNPIRQAFIARCLGSTVTYLRGLGLPINWP